jgi:hypothetical protein
MQNGARRFFSLEGTWSFNAMGHNVGQLIVCGTRAHEIQNGRRPTVCDSHFGGSVCPI